MQAITDIGQAVIRFGGREIFLNPCFLAMSRIGTPEEIVKAFVVVHAGHYPEHRINDPGLLRDVLARCYAKMVVTAANIVCASSDEDISLFTGSFTITKKGKLRYRPGKLPIAHIIELARHLIRHGVLGDQPPENTTQDRGEYSNSFDARSFVYMAVAHLGMGESEAWNMTMTSFRAAMNAKYPQKGATSVPTEEKYDEAMDWADMIVEMDIHREQVIK